MSHLVSGLEITGPLAPAYAEILTPAACQFVRELAERFETRRQQLLARRIERQREFDAGRLPGFLPETAHIRGGDWHVPPRILIAGSLYLAGEVLALNESPPS